MKPVRRRQHAACPVSGNGPAAVSGARPAGSVFPLEGTLHVDCLGTDGHIHEYWRDGSGWHNRSSHGDQESDGLRVPRGEHAACRVQRSQTITSSNSIGSPPRSMFFARGGSQVRPLVFLSRTDRASDRFGTSDRKAVTNTSQPVQTVAAFEMRPHRHFPLYLFAPLVTTVHRYRAAVRQSKTLGSNLNLTI